MIITLALVSLAAFGVCAVLLWHAVREKRQRSEARIAALGAAIDGPPVPSRPPAGGAAPLFDANRRSPMQGRPLLKVAAGFASAVTVIVLIAMTGGRDDTAPVAAAPGETPAPLELLSMRHARSGDALTVTGLVRNAGEASAGRVIAVVLAFDRRGDFVASGRAPLEFPLASGGDESPFQVTIREVPDVGRYRVSFRTETGVLRHVDRREPGRFASN